MKMTSGQTTVVEQLASQVVSREARDTAPEAGALPRLVPDGHAVKAVREKVGRVANELAKSALQMEQLALLEDYQFEEALLLPPEDVAKRYTAENGKQIEWRRHACLKLIALHCPAEQICDILHMNHRTVAALASQNGAAIAKFSQGFALQLLASGASDIALADTKRHEAGYKDLVIGAGIKFTHAQSLNMMTGASEQPAIDVDPVDERAEQARAWLEAKKPKVAEPELVEVK
jgi:hypothetical protein